MNNENTESLALQTAINLTDFALQQYESSEEALGDVFTNAEPETHFEILLDALEAFSEAAEESEYLEDMEDALAAIVCACIAISTSCGLFTEPIDGSEEV